jgi:hypothetical protein
MRLAVWICLLALFSGLVFAQDISGTIGGTILDPTGAAVPNAKITVTNTERSQVVRTITTDATGTYSAPLISVGTYSVRVEATGFKTEERKGIALNVADDLRINITLQVGAISDTVTVEATPVSVELGNPSAANTIDGKQVRDLSLGTRNYEQLVALMPGVTSNPVDELYIGNSSPSGLAATMPFFVNGNRNSANNWTVDGADNVDRGSNLTLMTFPGVDAISQFKVERGLYSAETGRAGGASISVVTKSGQSQYHGSLFEFFRNDALAANNWANNANRVNLRDSANPFNNCTTNFTSTCSARIPALRWNDFGFTIGGPVSLFGYNKSKNKTFFFYNQEHRRIITYTTFNPTLPTADMLNGNFGQPVCLSNSNPCTEVATSISANRINPNSLAYIKDIFSKLPLNTVNSVIGTTSGFFPQRNLYNSDQYISRIDHTISERFQLWGKFQIDQIPTVEPGGLFTGSAIPNGATTQTNSPGRTVTIHALNTIRPTIYNDAGFNFSQSAIHAVPVGLTAKANSPDINPAEPFTNTQGVVPSITLTGGSTLLGYGPYDEYNRNFNWFDNLTWIKGRHTWKFGISVNRYNKTENAASQQGNFSFTNTGAPSGTSSFQQSWANFLLGNVSTFTMPSIDITPDLWAWQHEAYAQDDFKVRPNLTLFLGVRWSFFGQPVDHNGLLDNFDPASYNPANAPKIDPANGNVIPGTANWQTNGIIVAGKNSPYGDHVANNVYKNFAPRVSLAWDPFGTGKTSIRAGYAVSYDSGLFGTYEQNSFANPPFVSSITLSNGNFSDIAAGTAATNPLSVNGTSVLGLHGTQIPALIPYVQQWSLHIQRTISKNLVAEIAYTGTKGTHLQGIVDINEAPPGAAYAAGLHQPNGNTIFTSTDIPRINAVRPYQGFQYINVIETAFDSNYHSLQAQLRKSFGAFGQFNTSFTWSKYLTDNGSDRSNAPQNSYNWHEGEYGPSSGDRKFVLTLNYTYELPIFRGSKGFVGAALKGWQFTGLGSFYTGAPFTVTTSGVDPAGFGNIGNNSAASGRPDMLCDPQANAPHQFGGSAQASAQNLLWFNTACFAPVPQGVIRPGNAGRGTVRGPGFVNMDMSLFKNFNLLKEGRMKLQMRLETFNTFNLVEPNGFASLNNTSTVFGQISSFRSPRRAQLAAKITF